MLKNRKELLFKIFIIAIFILVISMPRLTFNGTVIGLKLWVNSVLPGLFTAMILSLCILKLFPFTQGFAYIYIIITGILCGYPVGAMLCGDYHRNNPAETVCEKIMAYCNISSPSFVVNYIMLMDYCSKINAFFIIICIYLPVIISIFLVILSNHSSFFLASNNVSVCCTDKEKISVSSTIDEAVTKAVNNSLKLGAYIVLFSCLSQYFEIIPFMSAELKTLLSGITEITNGINMCSSLSWKAEYKLMLALIINAFGGISTIMQTAGIIRGSGLSIKKYAYHKLKFAALTAVNFAFIICVNNFILR